MKKYITTLLLVLSILGGITLQPSVNANAAGTTKTVVYSNFSQCKPKVSVVSQSENNVNLCISKVKGATKYKIYRADSKKGTYKCVGSTKSNTFKDTVTGNKKCYYKVKACMTNKQTKILSKCSNIVSATQPSQNQTTTNTAANTTKNTANQDTTVQNSTDTVSTNQDAQTFANEVLKLLNQERAKAGLGTLTTNATLQKAANKRAQEIVTSFSHTRPDGRTSFSVLDEYNISYRAAGENIAYGQKTPSEVMNAWMNSSGHRANILGSQFGKVGIGVYKGSNGLYYWTQVFTN